MMILKRILYVITIFKAFSTVIFCVSGKLALISVVSLIYNIAACYDRTFATVHAAIAIFALLLWVLILVLMVFEIRFKKLCKVTIVLITIATMSDLIFSFFVSRLTMKIMYIAVSGIITILCGIVLKNKFKEQMRNS